LHRIRIEASAYLSGYAVKGCGSQAADSGTDTPGLAPEQFISGGVPCLPRKYLRDYQL